jgi:hypothetical protein
MHAMVCLWIIFALHWLLLALSLVTVLGAVARAHGWR